MGESERGACGAGNPARLRQQVKAAYTGALAISATAAGRDDREEDTTMKRSETRVAFAVVGVFIWLGGLYAAIRGLLYHDSMQLRYGALAIFVGVAVAVIAMNLISVRRSPRK